MAAHTTPGVVWQKGCQRATLTNWISKGNRKRVAATGMTTELPAI